jgi:hypothetical protein
LGWALWFPTLATALQEAGSSTALRCAPLRMTARMGHGVSAGIEDALFHLL